jgi:nitroreductase
MMIASPSQQIVDQIITERRSVRILPDLVASEDIQRILEVASRAPSGSNTQPWKVYVLTGDSLTQLSEKILHAHQHPSTEEPHTEEYNYYPVKWVSPYLERRRKVGWDLYALLGLARENKQGMHAQHGRNYAFLMHRWD